MPKNSNNNELGVQKKYDLNSILSESDLSNEDKEDLKKKFNNLLACIDCLDSTQLQEDLLKEENGTRKLNTLVSGNFVRGNGIIKSELAKSKTNTVIRIENKKEDIENTNKEFLSVIFDELATTLQGVTNSKQKEKISNLLLTKIYEKEAELNKPENQKKQKINNQRGNNQENKQYFNYSIKELRDKNLLPVSYAIFKKNIEKDNGVPYKINQINNQIEQSYNFLTKEIKNKLNDGSFNSGNKKDDEEKKSNFLNKFDNVEKKAEAINAKKYSKRYIEKESSSLDSSLLLRLPILSTIKDWYQGRKKKKYEKENKMHSEAVGTKRPSIKKVKKGFNELLKEAQNLPTMYDNDIKKTEEKLKILDALENEMKNQTKKNKGPQLETKDEEIKQWRESVQKKLFSQSSSKGKKEIIKYQRNDLNTTLNKQRTNRSNEIKKVTNLIKGERNKIESQYLLDTKIIQEEITKSRNNNEDRLSYKASERGNIKEGSKYYRILPNQQKSVKIRGAWNKGKYEFGLYLDKGDKKFSLTQLYKAEELKDNMGLDIEEEYKHQKRKQIENLSKDKQEFLAKEQEAKKEATTIGQGVQHQQKNMSPSGRKNQGDKSLDKVFQGP